MRLTRRFLLSSSSSIKPAGMSARHAVLPAEKPAWRRSVGAIVLASFLSVPLFSIAASNSYGRDDMPPPSRAPRTPVVAERLPGSVEPSPRSATTYSNSGNSKSRSVSAASATTTSAGATVDTDMPKEIAGGAVAIDGQTIKLRENGRDLTLRLAGVVAPPLTTTEGMNARAALDAIMKDQTINCMRRDRDTDGRAVMNCTYNGGKDVAEELLFTGTVLYSRAGTLSPELAVRYKAAEETAQSRRAGMWTRVASVNVGAASTISANTASSARPAVQPAPAVDTVASGTVLAVKPATAVTAPVPAVVHSNDNSTGNWLKAMGLLGALFGMLAWLDQRHMRRTRYQHELEVRTERTVLAAALTGELAAARDICEARAAQITTTTQGAMGNRNIKPVWPRLRTYIYQAHVEHIGLLGPVLARQVASIYGQMADYSAATRDEADAQMTAASMARTLARLCGYIEITLEGLTDVEQSGEAYYPATGMIGATQASEKHAALAARKVTQKLPVTTPATPLNPLPTGTQRKIAAPVNDKTAAKVETPATSIPTAESDMMDGFAAPKETRAEVKVEAKAEVPANKTDDDNTPSATGSSDITSEGNWAEAADKVAEKPAARTPVTPTGQIPWWKQRQIDQKAAQMAAQQVEAAEAVKKPVAASDAAEPVSTQMPVNPLPIARRTSNLASQRQRAVNALKEETAKLEAIDAPQGSKKYTSNTGIIAPDIPATA